MIGLSGTARAGEFDGTWTLEDSDGTPFTAILNADGSASGTHGKDMKYGSWTVEDGAAVIRWKTGWTTRISREGDHYVKAAYKSGVSLSDKPTNTSSAVKQP
jgi:hypothetical protein